MARGIKQLPMEGDPNVPPLAWVIAKMISDPDYEMDSIIFVQGDRGAGKSTFSIGLAYAIAYFLARIHHDHISDHFDFWDNIKSVDKNGSFEMFSGDTIKKMYQVLIGDDFSITADSHDFQTKLSGSLRKIFTVSRPYRACVILNSPSNMDIDKRIRNFAVISIKIIGVNRKLKKTVCRITLTYKQEGQSELMGRYFRFHAKRVYQWTQDKPPAWMLDIYKKVRKRNTDLLLDEINKETSGKKEPLSEEDIETDSEQVQVIKKKYGPLVRDMKSQGMKNAEISRRLGGLSQYYINKCLGGVT